MPTHKMRSEARESCGTQLRFYRQYFEQVPEFWFIRCGQSHKVVLNAALAKLLGVRRRSLRWEEWLAIVHPQDMRRMEDAISRSLKTNSEFLTPTHVRLRDGTYLRVHAAGMSVQCPLNCPNECRLIVGQLKYSE